MAVDGVDMVAASAAARAGLRLRRIGLVFQSGELLPELSAGDNVALPLLLAGRVDARAVAEAWLVRVGLAGRYHDSPAVLSGGEVQRVAIARALAHAPVVVLGDEPTGALDAVTAGEVTGLLVGCARERGAAVLIATHDPAVAATADRTVRLTAGRLVDGSDFVTA